MGTYDGQSPTDTNMYFSLNMQYIKERWDYRAGRWDSDLSDSSSHLNRKESYKRFLEIFDKILSDTNDLENKSFLDLGCGTGALLEFCSNRFKSSVGIDISKEMIERAHQKQLKNVTLLMEDCFHYFDTKHCFDVIASRGVLLSHYGYDNSSILLTKIYNSLNKGGIIFIDALSKNDVTNPSSKKLFTTNELLRIFNDSGFEKVDVFSYDNYPLMYVKASKCQFF